MIGTFFYARGRRPGMSQAESSSVPLWWVLAFVVLALGLGALAVVSSGGSLVAPGAALLPRFLAA